MSDFRPIPKPGKTSFRGRAILGITVEISYVVILLAIILTCWWLVYMMFFHWSFRNIYVVAILISVSLSLLPGLFVVIPKVRPFGLQIHPGQHRALWNMSKEVADMLGTKPADRIFLDHEVNAAVIEQGGFLGFGRKRDLIIGLGLMSACTVSELKCVLAHEYGHYAHGDTRLSGWVARTAQRIRRTGGIDETAGCMRPFNLIYILLTYRLKASISRMEEYAANEVSIKLLGRTLFLESHRTIAVGLYLQNKFWEQGGVNALRDSENYLEALRTYIKSAKDQDQFRNIERTVGQEPLHPFDTHPGYGELVAFARQFPDKEIERDDRPAREILDEPDLTEVSLSKWMRVLVSL
jgi:Zn-dependent protease with chaperone function